jgi:hypothetical protein
MKIERIYVGGWFQRTTLHLSEIRDFLMEGRSPLKLEGKKLQSLRSVLDIEGFEMRVEDLEYVYFESRDIEIKIYEDGLIVLAKSKVKDLKADIQDLTSFYEGKLSPALSYLFSLGAPIPKELANIKTIYPYFVVMDRATLKDVSNLLMDFEQEKHFQVRRKGFEIYRGDTLYIINNLKESARTIEQFVNEEIFLREFKGQLHRYLNLHRIIWEEIAEVKEKGSIKGSDIGGFKTKVESYAKTINLIGARIGQMGGFVRTREAIVKHDKEMAPFLDVLQFRYETLIDTLSYIKDLWAMTSNYVDSALKIFTDLQAKSTEASVKNLTVVTFMGVGASVLGLLTKPSSQVTAFGILTFLGIILLGYASNWIMKGIYKRRSYEVKDAAIAKDIK